MFEPLQKYFHRVAKNYGVSRELNASLVIFYAKQVFAELFKKIDPLSPQAFPATYSRGTITVKVKSSAWANEIIIHKEKIIDEMNKKIGKVIIKKIITKQI